MIYEVNRGQWAIPRLRKLLEIFCPRIRRSKTLRFPTRLPAWAARTLSINARRLEGDSASQEMILLAIETKQKRTGPFEKILLPEKNRLPRGNLAGKEPRMKVKNPRPRKVDGLRARAEGSLRHGHKGDGKLAEDADRTLHELQVHQIELQMQNEELRRTQEQLEEACERYANLYDFAPCAYLTLGSKGEIREANLAAATLLGTGAAAS